MSGYYLIHHGIKGQRWGVRRYQNPDGTLTEAGKRRYRSESISDSDDYMRFVQNEIYKKTRESPERKSLNAFLEKERDSLIWENPESWEKAETFRKKYEDLLVKELSDTGLDKYYEIGAFISQFYGDGISSLTDIRRKNDTSVLEDPDLGSLFYDNNRIWRWMGGEDISYPEYILSRREELNYPDELIKRAEETVRKLKPRKVGN